MIWAIDKIYNVVCMFKRQTYIWLIDWLRYILMAELYLTHFVWLILLKMKLDTKIKKENE